MTTEAGGGVCHRVHPKGTERNSQEYQSPLLVLTGEEYDKIMFAELHDRICLSCEATARLGWHKFFTRTA